MATEQVPDRPAELEAAADEQGLGSLTCYDRADLRSTNRGAVWTLLVVGALTVVLGAFLARVYYRISGNVWTATGLLDLGVIMVVAGVVVALRRGKSAWVCLYDHGLAWQSTGQRPLAMRWTDVEEVSRADVTFYVNGVRGATHHDTYVRGRGGSIPVTRIFPAVLDLTERIVAATAPLMLQSMAGRLDRGETVVFGPLFMDDRGLSHADQRVAWSDVTEVRVHKSELQVLTARQRKPWVSVSAVGFPNLVVMLTLADALVRAHRPSSV